MTENLRARGPAGRAAALGICMALAIALSLQEGWLPALPAPGAKLGLSNIVTMFVLSSMGLPAALAVAAGKAVFALFRGGTAFLMSFAGGAASTLVMAVCLRFFRGHVSYIGSRRGRGGGAQHGAARRFHGAAGCIAVLFRALALADGGGRRDSDRAGAEFGYARAGEEPCGR